MEIFGRGLIEQLKFILLCPRRYGFFFFFFNSITEEVFFIFYFYVNLIFGEGNLNPRCFISKIPKTANQLCYKFFGQRLRNDSSKRKRDRERIRDER